MHTQDYAYDRKDREGKRFGDELERIGWKGEEEVGARKMKAFFELHIEQGPILEDEDIDIGVVTHGPGPEMAAGDADRSRGAYRLHPDAEAAQCGPGHGAE